MCLPFRDRSRLTYAGASNTVVVSRAWELARNSSIDGLYATLSDSSGSGSAATYSVAGDGFCCIRGKIAISAGIKDVRIASVVIFYKSGKFYDKFTGR